MSLTRERLEEYAISLMRHLDGIAVDINDETGSVTYADDINLHEVLVCSGIEDWRIDAFLAIFWLADAVASNSKEFLEDAMESLKSALEGEDNVSSEDRDDT